MTLKDKDYTWAARMASIEMKTKNGSSLLWLATLCIGLGFRCLSAPGKKESSFLCHVLSSWKVAQPQKRDSYHKLLHPRDSYPISNSYMTGSMCGIWETQIWMLFHKHPVAGGDTSNSRSNLKGNHLIPSPTGLYCEM